MAALLWAVFSFRNKLPMINDIMKSIEKGENESMKNEQRVIFFFFFFLSFNIMLIWFELFKTFFYQCEWIVYQQVVHSIESEVEIRFVLCSDWVRINDSHACTIYNTSVLCPFVQS